MSAHVIRPGRLVVICCQWTRQKRLQGSHGKNDAQANAFNDLVVEGKHALGNTAMLIGAPRAGMGRQA